jgi:heme exporter protein C
LLYTATLVLRQFGGDGAAERKFASALGVLGTVNLPIVHYAVQKWGGNHPQVISGEGGGLKHPAMVQGLLLGFVALALLSTFLLWMRFRVAKAEARLIHAEQRAIEEDTAEDTAEAL